MESEAGHEVTAWLRAWSKGDSAALERLIPAVDHELHGIARRCLSGRHADPVLDSTALIQEAYLRLIDANYASWQDRAHFFAVCAKIMRRMLVDHARARASAKRGGGLSQISLEQALPLVPDPPRDLVAIDEALDRLARFDERKGRVVELRFFGGLKIEEAAEVLQVSPETVRRDWRLAKAWLLRELGGSPAP